jgi:hypothetical protein
MRYQIMGPFAIYQTGEIPEERVFCIKALADVTTPIDPKMDEARYTLPRIWPPPRL